MSRVAPRTLDSAAFRETLVTAKPPVRARTIALDGCDPVKTILSVLLSSRFRKGSLSAMDAEEFLAQHRDRVAARVARNEPVQLTLVGFPFKVPNPLKVGGRTLPDLAEVAALRALELLNLEVRDVYPPGIEVVILHDGAFIADAFGVSQQETCDYTDYFRWLVQATGTDAFIRCEDLVCLLRAHRSEGSGVAAPHGGAGDNIAASFRKTLGMLNARWVQSEMLPGVYDAVREGDPASLTGEAAALYSQVLRSMERYAVCDDILHRFDPRPCAFPEAIHATTKQRPGRLALWLVRRGRALLPWHGVGVLDQGGRIEVRYAAEVEDGGEHRPVFLQGESTPFFYELRGR
jgi:hypothetical protein